MEKFPFNADLHSHSTFSDGVFTPEELAQRAHRNQVDLWALTDHDTLEGAESAQQAAQKWGISFVAGVEISTLFEGVSVHIVGLNVDFHNQVLKEGIASVRNTRFARAQKMSAEFEKIGIANALEGAMAFCQNQNTISRAHFARFLVNIGKAKTKAEVFENFMVPGKPGYVPHQWASIDQAISWIHQANGVAVLAHPGRYDFSKNAFARLLSFFKENGGDALEVASSAHSKDEILRWAKTAQHYDFYASLGSDFHDATECHCDLGKAPALPAHLKPVWNLWLA